MLGKRSLRKQSYQIPVVSKIHKNGIATIAGLYQADVGKKLRLPADPTFDDARTGSHLTIDFDFHCHAIAVGVGRLIPFIDAVDDAEHAKRAENDRNRFTEIGHARQPHKIE